MSSTTYINAHQNFGDFPYPVAGIPPSDRGSAALGYLLAATGGALVTLGIVALVGLGS